MEWLANKAAVVRVQVGPVPSPCISVCRMDAATALCQGCLRTLDEIAAWSKMDDALRREIWGRIQHRATPRAADAATADTTPNGDRT